MCWRTSVGTPRGCARQVQDDALLRRSRRLPTHGIEQAVKQPRLGAEKAYHPGSGRPALNDPEQQFHAGTVPANQPAVGAFVLLQRFARPDDVRERGCGGEAQVETLPGQRVDVTRRITDQSHATGEAPPDALAKRAGAQGDVQARGRGESVLQGRKPSEQRLERGIALAGMMMIMSHLLQAAEWECDVFLHCETRGKIGRYRLQIMAAGHEYYERPIRVVGVEGLLESFATPPELIL